MMNILKMMKWQEKELFTQQKEWTLMINAI